MSELKLEWDVEGCDPGGSVIGYLGRLPVAVIRRISVSGLWASTQGLPLVDYRDAASGEEAAVLERSRALLSGEERIVWHAPGWGTGPTRHGTLGTVCVAQVMQLLGDTGWVPIGVPGDYDAGPLELAQELSERDAVATALRVVAVMEGRGADSEVATVLSRRGGLSHGHAMSAIGTAICALVGEPVRPVAMECETFVIGYGPGMLEPLRHYLTMVPRTFRDRISLVPVEEVPPCTSS